MKKQQSFTDLEYSMRKRKTKREEFLEIMDAITPWDEIVAMIEPYYYKKHLGRRPRGIEVMFRMYLLATWFNLSDEAVEDAIYDSYAMRKFMGMDFTQESVPDATTLCKFRKLINDNGLGERYFAACKEFLEQHGRMMHGGTIVDATIIDAPSSTKNAEGKRDPEMHQVKKGNQWYFGAKLHVGVDAGSGYIHTTVVTAANVPDGAVAHKLLREDDHVMYGDSAFCAVDKHKEVRNDPHLSQIDYRTNKRKPYRKNAWIEGEGTRWLRRLEYQKSRVRCKVEYAFHVINGLFGFRKTRYKGLAKLKTHLDILCASANFFMLATARRAEKIRKSKTALLFEAPFQG